MQNASDEGRWRERLAPRWILLVALALAAALAGGTLCCGAVQRSDGGVGILAEGSLVPDLSGTDHRGQAVVLREMSQQRAVLVYFYPKDDTPGCTTEACALRDAWARYEKQGIAVVGVSSDSIEDHRSFAKSNSLPFSLIADEDGTWANAFGVKSFAGLYSRVSFLVAPGGKIAKVYPDVDPGAHAEQVLEDARALP